MKTTIYKVYFNDNVNEPTLMGEYDNLDEAITFADTFVKSDNLVQDTDNVDVHATASTARIEVYEGDMIKEADVEAELQEPTHVTAYFYV